jgi:AmmeMemoRadiSam system radical SAM enzyme
MERIAELATPEAIARAAKDAGCKSVAFTYNDPTIFAEYAMDTADACHELGLETVAVTAGYIRAEPRVEMYAKMDAANVDLKAFTEEFYRKQTASSLAPVKETLRYLVKETSVWTEITTLIIPGLNDKRPRADGARRVGRRRARRGRADPLQRLPPRLQADRPPADAARHATPSARHRATSGASLRVHG